MPSPEFSAANDNEAPDQEIRSAALRFHETADRFLKEAVEDSFTPEKIKRVMRTIVQEEFKGLEVTLPQAQLIIEKIVELLLQEDVAEDMAEDHYNLYIGYWIEGLTELVERTFIAVQRRVPLPEEREDLKTFVAQKFIQSTDE